MNLSFSIRRFFVHLLLLLGGAFTLAVAALLVKAHVTAITEMRADVLPLAARITPLSDRLAILQKQVEVSKLAAAVRPDTAEERLHMYVLPQDAALDRAISAINTTTDTLRSMGELKDMSAITPGAALPVTLSGAGVSTLHLLRRTLSFSVTVTDDGRRTLEHFIDLSGLLTVQDALTEEQSQHLFALTEDENPAGITALGQFLSTDLFTFLRDPKGSEEHLLSSFSSDAFSATIRSIAESAFFREEAAFAKGPVGEAILRQHLWPLPFLETEKLQLTDAGDGWYRLSLVLSTYGRGK